MFFNIYNLDVTDNLLERERERERETRARARNITNLFLIYKQGCLKKIRRPFVVLRLIKKSFPVVITNDACRNFLVSPRGEYF
jgi:hypothetical protein